MKEFFVEAKKVCTQAHVFDSPYASAFGFCAFINFTYSCGSLSY
jgi:hypothetical protein